MRKQRRGDNAQVFRITGARQSLADDVRGRQRRYVISMSIRTVSVILAAVLWSVERPVAIVALVLGAVLPYIAVVIANAGRENTPSLPSTFVTTPLRPMIDPARENGFSPAPGSSNTSSSSDTSNSSDAPGSSDASGSAAADGAPDGSATGPHATRRKRPADAAAQADPTRDDAHPSADSSVPDDRG